jgi:hypothetical protein
VFAGMMDDEYCTQSSFIVDEKTDFRRQVELSRCAGKLKGIERQRYILREVCPGW